MERIAILVGKHGRGSNMAALVKASQSGAIRAEVHCVVSPSADAPALETASALGVPTVVVPYGDDFAARLVSAFEGATIIALAGFMRLVPAEVLEKWPNRVLNIHPALLPKHGGKGMYGIKVHESVISAGDVESGCTVHYVTEHYDEGAVVVQKRCPVLSDDTPDTLAARVLQLEHQAYAEAVQKVIDGRVSSPTP